ncbi:Cytochrome c-type biogenesis protein DsbD, protein-disulfide reductase [Acidisarcina polymorpha]|uniref:Cytochrome c-type biogenesis protein DsbD, protein-disulfide reductase n=1 Tax=Acidisarcina polymorpha TaxID=2211140 RepID=A0A2Z5G6H7_9BACT|nr:thioredoxin family protein [Acidisarcina polymorpha]AXC14842.1 Cytochrome c-type biogenesis protein DsbD, protein-disulfide reductase [Acidisarcina polymorpha]
MRLHGKTHYIWLAQVLLALTCSAGAQAPPAKVLDSTGAVQAPHLSVQLITAKDVIHPGDSLHAGLYFKLDKGWHVYWSNAGDSGEPPAIRWTLPTGITADPMQFPTPQRLPLGPLMDYGYEGEVVFPILLHAAASLPPGALPAAAAKVNWLVCREVCIPGKAELTLPLTVAAAGNPGKDTSQALIQSYQQKLPQPLPPDAKASFAATPTGFSVVMKTGRQESSAQFFPYDQSQIDNPAKQLIKPLKDGIQLDIKKDENLKTTLSALHGLVVFPDGRSYDVQFQPGSLAAAPSSTNFAEVLRYAGLAFLGGIILNLMPCVFPVLFIKGLSLVQSSGEERVRMRAHGLVYTVGIIVSFWAVVAVLLALRAGGQQFGWGFQFQSPAFVAVIALFLFFLALSLAGMFEIGLTLTNAGSGLASRGGYAGSFFTGVLAMVVATPCTAPLMGAATGFALAQSATVTFVIFTALALGLAAPYLLLSFNPAWTRFLPRPGAWMEVLKQATAVPLFATVIWLVWVFAQSAGINALIGLLGGFLLLAISGWVLGRWPAKTPAAFVAALVGILAIVLPIYAARKYADSSASAATAKGPSTWEAFTPQLIDGYRAQGKPVLVDFTASWCLSCQVNERVVLDREDVQKRLHDSGIALVRADWTRHDETIAQTLAALGRSGVPTYVLYPGGSGDQPKILPEVLTTGIVFDALDELKLSKQAKLSTKE